MVLNDVINGIAVQLDTLFGYTVYIDSVKQDLAAPCFLIKAVTTSQEQEVDRFYKRKQKFDILYFPQNTEDPTREIETVTDALWMGLEYINMGSDIVRGVKMHREVADNVLHFFVNYDIRVEKERPTTDLMRILNQKESVKIG